MVFQTKGEIALAMLKAAHADGVPLGKILLGDADFGRLWELRQWCRSVDMRYGVGVHSTQKVWDAGGIWTKPMTAAEYAQCVPNEEFRRISWRAGADGEALSARFAFLRVQVTRGGAEPVEGVTPSEWLVMEWRDGDNGPEHFYLCDLPESATYKQLVGAIKERWRIERVHQELKGEVGFDHFEGRSWPGWQHHVSLALACHALLIAERCVAFPPQHPADIPLARTAQRPQRHVAHSVPSHRLRLGHRAAERYLPRCPTCCRSFVPRGSPLIRDAATQLPAPGQ